MKINDGNVNSLDFYTAHWDDMARMGVGKFKVKLGRVYAEGILKPARRLTKLPLCIEHFDGDVELEGNIKTLENMPRQVTGSVTLRRLRLNNMSIKGFPVKVGKEVIFSSMYLDLRELPKHLKVLRMFSCAIYNSDPNTRVDKFSADYTDFKESGMVINSDDIVLSGCQNIKFKDSVKKLYIRSLNNFNKTCGLKHVDKLVIDPAYQALLEIKWLPEHIGQLKILRPRYSTESDIEIIKHMHRLSSITSVEIE